MSASTTPSEHLPVPSSSVRDSVARADDECYRDQEDVSRPLKPVGMSWEDFAIQVAISEHLDWEIDEL